MTGKDTSNGCSAPRRAIHAPVCADSAAELRAFCAEHGVTVTAYLDALGHALAPLRGQSTEKLREIAPLLEDTLLHARKIAAGRLRRR